MINFDIFRFENSQFPEIPGFKALGTETDTQPLT
jgi:hypothetical protein